VARQDLVDSRLPGVRRFYFSHGAGAIEGAEPESRRDGNDEESYRERTGARGRIDSTLLQSTVPGLAVRRTHICGPPAMMGAMEGVLRNLGVPENQIWTEAFGSVTSFDTVPRR